MKRSEINRALRELEAMVKEYRFSLPPFCHFTPEEWANMGHEYDEIRHNMLGWDITDYGLGDFEKVGFSLITLRNHWHKMEDIINRGGGTLLIRVYNSLPDEEIDRDSDVTVHMDGVTRTVPAGTQLRLEPGMSISIQPRLYHDFEIAPGSGNVLIGEVSQCNDDNTDNRFNPPVGRFPAIEEDEPPYRLLCNEYPEAAE